MTDNCEQHIGISLRSSQTAHQASELTLPKSYSKSEKDYFRFGLKCLDFPDQNYATSTLKF